MPWQCHPAWSTTTSVTARMAVMSQVRMHAPGRANALLLCGHPAKCDLESAAKQLRMVKLAILMLLLYAFV